MTLEELAKQSQELNKKTIELNERCDKLLEKQIRQAGGLNAKVELNKSGFFEVVINGITLLVARNEYEAIEKTL